MGNIIFGFHDKLMQIDSTNVMLEDYQWRGNGHMNTKLFFPQLTLSRSTQGSFVQNSKIITKEALSETELMNFKGVGTLESWNSDGLRTYKNHGSCAKHDRKNTSLSWLWYIKVLRETGFFQKKKK